MHTLFYFNLYQGTIESVLTSCITVLYGNCCAADRKTLQRTVNTAEKNHQCPSPLHPGLHDALAKPIVSWRTPPILPTVSSSSYHQEDSTGASEPAPPDCSSGPVQTTCSNTLSSIRTRPHKRLSNICMFTCLRTKNYLTLFPSQLLDSRCSLCTCTVFAKHLYSCTVCIF